jgi:hypothetical protein
VAVKTRVLLVAAGALIAVAGIVWTLQGLGYITGSFMTGATPWAITGHRRGATRPDRARLLRRQVPGGRAPLRGCSQAAVAAPREEGLVCIVPARGTYMAKLDGRTR